MVERAVSFQSSGARVYGILGVPSAPPAAGVVLLHGWTGCRIGPNRIFVEASRAFNGAGVATLRFDFRGRGDSEGDATATDLDMMIADACEAVDVLKRETGVARVALLGICSGANVAIGAATLRPDVRDLILWSVFTFQARKARAERIRRTGHFALDYARKAFRAETWKKLVGGRINFRMVRRVLFGGEAKPEREGRNLKDSRRDIVGAFADYRGRALFVYGTKDPEGMPASEWYRAFCAEHGLDASFKFIEGTNHNFHSAAWKREVIETSIAWLLDESATATGDPRG